ncbi:MAG: SIMPL domain-containing protein [Finegoldia magna]|uniref:SIMPL domain-containing protein n=1 Tax=Peptoniphilaceae TaxID=1570339 RepID=UPI0026EF8582|nr:MULTISPECIES: SIMPL domain-containing protein [Peptoniphilaceae]MBS5777689.1 SIMPL domain-containing protein [Finegoldia magna]MDU2566731.1 SIMPL domain-containing protein [Anaerococcus sp.]MDU2575974.1 SIMPL domain-containing protein [Finegoldia magna]MDU7479756.1 SIMPL domain-containing protein [Finegoldia magna]MDU7502382.1 SIMPL domain-containing protein [Finegoldia magna]
MERTIRVKGKGKISVKPDTIKITIKAEGLRWNYDETVEQSTKDTRILRDALEKAGLDPKNLKTTHFSIDSKYKSYHDKNNDYKEKFVGYEYNHRAYIEFDNDNKILGRVLYELAHCDVKVKFEINHTVKDKEKVKNDLLEKAVEDSTTKAKVLAKASGVKLKEILSIDYSWGEIEIYSETMNDLMLCEAASRYDIDIEADDIDVRDTVTITWIIE